MSEKTDILCIGSVLWDIIGRAPNPMRVGSDVPGRITRLPGGVAMIIAMTLSRYDLSPAVLTVIGDDDEGRELRAACRRLKVNTDFAYISKDLPTDRYMAIEGGNGLIAAIADAHSLEAAGDKILAPLKDGRLATPDQPFSGVIALDGNLTEELLATIATSPLFAKADLRVAPASPGKAERLRHLFQHPGFTLYVNLEEASLICHEEFHDAAEAAKGLCRKGAKRALVTDGGDMAGFAFDDHVVTATPPKVMVSRVTGAGDTFMAAHIHAELNGMTGLDALVYALKEAATYVSGETAL